MKIIKQFEDPEYAKASYNDIWCWGLAEDGELFYQRHRRGDWIRFDQAMIDKPITLKNMVRIVKEFGPLLVLL